jgi:threonine synthase
MTKIACTACHQNYPLDRIPFRCECGGAFDYIEFPLFRLQVNHSIGLIKYATLLGLKEGDEVISLGEGNTPLLPARIAAQDVFLKMESMNPTGSYKDRGTSVLISFLKSRGVEFAVEDSSGNAGASFAAYCAAAGIKARVYVPESASGPKRTQIEMYGAELVRVPGPRQNAADAVLQAGRSGSIYGSHAWMPFGLPGIATIAYEIVEQLGDVPGTILAPAGHGGLLYGLIRGFEAMALAGYIQYDPYFVGVQAIGCAPIMDAFTRKTTETREVELSETVAEGVKVTQPVRASAILSKLLSGKGRIVSINETDLRDAWQQSAKQGMYMEPTSALVWAALNAFSTDFKTPIVAVISGSGYKSSIH